MTKDIARFHYGFDITVFNRYINFRSVALGPILTAELTVGNYTATELAKEVKKRMEQVDSLNTYTTAILRSTGGGLSPRFQISTSGVYLDLLFLSGINAATSPRDVLGFSHTDKTGSTSYTGELICGTILIPEFPTYDYLPPEAYVMNDGVANISAAGIKETLVFAQMFFTQGQWKYITNFGNRTQFTEWAAFLKYATRQLKFEFSPSINEDVELFYQVTLESTSADGKGMGFKLKQQRGEGLYRFYDTGLLKMRLIPS